jgi:hypothetical protein
MWRQEFERGPTAEGRSESPIFRYGGWGEPQQNFGRLQQSAETVREQSGTLMPVALINRDFQNS